MIVTRIIKDLNALRLLSSALIVLSFSFLTSCGQKDDDVMANSKGSVSISVSAGLWNEKSQGRAETRTGYSGMAENGGSKTLPTTFTKGDAIGVFIVDKSGKVVIANRKFTYDGSSWTTDSPIEYTSGLGDYTFYAYYPYQGSPTGTYGVDENVSASGTDAEFFASLIAGWTPKSDQSSLEAFSSSDLMTAKGTAKMPYYHEVQVSFTMRHRMGLLVTKETLSFYNIKDATDTWTVKQTFTGNIPYAIGDCLYFFVKPGVETALGSKKAAVGSGEMEQLYFSGGEPSEK